jgi:hypothetical protein
MIYSFEAPASGGGVRSQGAQGDGKSPASGGGQSHRPRPERSEFTLALGNSCTWLYTSSRRNNRQSKIENHKSEIRNPKS